MPQEPIESTEPTQLPPPDLITGMIEQDDDLTLQSIAATANLTALQTSILIAVAGNVFAEIKHTDDEIGTELGTSRQYIYLCRQNPKFQRALAGYIREQIKGNHDKIIQNIYNAGLKDWKAHEFLLKYDGSYTPSSRIQSQNVNISAQLDAPKSPQQAIYGMVERFVRLGYDKTRLIQEIDAAYDEITNQ